MARIFGRIMIWERVIFSNTYSEMMLANELRQGKEKIPRMAIAATSNKLEMPSYEEGFDELYFVKNDGETMTVSEWRE